MLETITTFNHTPFQPLISSASSKRKVALLREEFVALTHDPFMAILLNQLVYWSQRVKDGDDFLREESKDSHTSSYGWFYKSAEELMTEIMTCVSISTLRRHLKHLEDKGWISTRTNPLNKWDKTAQYRVNLKKLSIDMKYLGHSLEGYEKSEEATSAESPSQTPSTPESSTCAQNGASIHHPDSIDVITVHTSKLPPCTHRSDHSGACNTEITSKTTNKEHSSRAYFDLNSFLKVWKTHIGQDVTLTTKRRCKLKSLLQQHFHNDFEKWTQFCEQIKSSSFLMGEGPRKWHITFDWILQKENALKVLEGNFEDPKSFSLHNSPKPSVRYVQDLSLFLPTIEDPLWKKWCHHFTTQFSLTPSDIQALESSKFLEFDGRLVWIEYKTLHVLDHMEKLQFKLLLVAQQIFPKAWDIRFKLSSSPP